MLLEGAREVRGVLARLLDDRGALARELLRRRRRRPAARPGRRTAPSQTAASRAARGSAPGPAGHSAASLSGWSAQASTLCRNLRAKRSTRGSSYKVTFKLIVDGSPRFRPRLQARHGIDCARSVIRNQTELMSTASDGERMTTKPRLLLVEDTPSILRLYHEVLKQARRRPDRRRDRRARARRPRRDHPRCRAARCRAARRQRHRHPAPHPRAQSAVARSSSSPRTARSRSRSRRCARAPTTSSSSRFRPTG